MQEVIENRGQNSILPDRKIIQSFGKDRENEDWEPLFMINTVRHKYEWKKTASQAIEKTKLGSQNIQI